MHKYSHDIEIILANNAHFTEDEKASWREFISLTADEIKIIETEFLQLTDREITILETEMTMDGLEIRDWWSVFDYWSQ